MGPIEQEMVNGYSSLSARLKALRSPPPKLKLPDNSYKLQHKIEQLTKENNELRLDLWAAKVKLKKLSTKLNALPTYTHPIHKIIALVCERENISCVELIGQRRFKAVMLPRQIAAYLCATKTEKSLPDIGKHFGRRDHTTIMHARNKIIKLRKADPELDKRLRWYEEQLGQ